MASAKATAQVTATASERADSTAADPKPRILLHPVPLVDSPLAKGLSFGRIAVLLSLLAWRMDSLIADPVSMLRLSLPVVAAIQVVYAVVCVPPAGSAQQLGKKARPGEKKKTEASVNSITVSYHLYIRVERWKLRGPAGLSLNNILLALLLIGNRMDEIQVLDC